MGPRPQHRLAAVWFADISNYSPLANRDESAAFRLVRAFQEATREAVRSHDGEVVKFMGDGALARFPSTDDAVRAAHALRRAYLSRVGEARVEEHPLRIGVHVGDVMTTPDGDLYGDGVNVADRLEREAGPDQVVVSEDVWRQLRHRPEFRFESLGERALPGIGEMELRAAFPPDEPEGHLATAGNGRTARAVREPAIGWPREDAPEGIAGLVSELRRRALWIVDRRKAAVVAIGVVVVLVAGWFVVRSPSWREVEPPGGPVVAAASLDPARLAVLYFDDHSPGGGNEHLAAGFTEAITHELSQIEALEVVSRNQLKPYRDGSVGTDSIARAVGAGTIVEGSVSRAGDQLQVIVQMIDVRDGAHLASIREDRAWGELFAVQDEIVAEVVGRLRRRLGTELRQRERRAETRSVGAWELVQRAERLREQARESGDSELGAALRRDAEGLLVRAAGLDPAWIEPVLGRGWLGVDEGTPDGLERALALAERARGIAGRDPRALELRGTARYHLARAADDSVAAAERLAGAERDLGAAVDADPSLAGAWITLAELRYDAKGDYAAAREAARRAHEEDPFLLQWKHFYWLCDTSLQLEEYEEATRWCAEGRRRYPEIVDLVGAELAILASRDGPEPDPAAAWRLVAEAAAVSSAERRDLIRSLSEMHAAAVLVRTDMADSARAVVARARESADDPSMDYIEAYVRLLLGERQRSVTLLHRFAGAAPSYRSVLAHDHWFEPLAGDPGFESIVDRRRLPLFCAILCRAP